MSSCVPSSALDKQHFKNDLGILIGTSFQAFDIHSTINDTDAVSVLPQYMIACIQPSIIVCTHKMLDWFVN
jgi:hypothetical protein